MSSRKHNRSYLRMVSWRKSRRKRRISKSVFGADIYKHLHQYSKNELFIAGYYRDCWPSLFRKTNSAAIKYRYSDQKKLSSLTEQLKCNCESEEVNNE